MLAVRRGGGKNSSLWRGGIVQGTRERGWRWEDVNSAAFTARVHLLRDEDGSRSFIIIEVVPVYKYDYNYPCPHFSVAFPPATEMP